MQIPETINGKPVKEALQQVTKSILSITGELDRDVTYTMPAAGPEQEKVTYHGPNEEFIASLVHAYNALKTIEEDFPNGGEVLISESDKNALKEAGKILSMPSQMRYSFPNGNDPAKGRSYTGFQAGITPEQVTELYKKDIEPVLNELAKDVVEQPPLHVVDVTTSPHPYKRHFGVGY